MHQRKVSPQGNLKKVGRSVNFDPALSLLYKSSNSCRGEDTAKPDATGPDTFDERALRHQIDRHLAGNHLLLGLGVEADVAGDRPGEKTGPNQLANAPAGHRRIVGNDDQIALALAHKPHPMNPPIMRLAPSGIMATASSTATIFMSVWPVSS